MKTEKEIKERIKIIEQVNIHCLNRKLETLAINAPVALMQLSAISKIDELYWTLGEKPRPKYIYDGGKTKIKLL